MEKKAERERERGGKGRTVRPGVGTEESGLQREQVGLLVKSHFGELDLC